LQGKITAKKRVAPEQPVRATSSQNLYFYGANQNLSKDIDAILS